MEHCYNVQHGRIKNSRHKILLRHLGRSWTWGCSDDPWSKRHIHWPQSAYILIRCKGGAEIIPTEHRICWVSKKKIKKGIWSSKEERSNIVQLTFLAMMTWHLIIDFHVPLKAEAKAFLGFSTSIAFQIACYPIEQMLMDEWINGWMHWFT